MSRKIGLTFSRPVGKPGKRAARLQADREAEKEAAHGKSGNVEAKAGNG